ncbi:MAG: DUF4267 domain-containing protein [Bdellovibrionales bacterium]|nr:DUF4267 domain-containing protein [Bdellovibrionales bacterium]MCB0415820.1 DUF4267 domain-containing protein [Bdellovibrionales bacterium]
MNFIELLFYLSPVIGLTTLGIGIAAVLRPEPMSKKFGITVNGQALPYVISTGVRDVFIGLTVLVLFYLKNWLALGCINLFISIVAASDFLVVQKYGHKKTSYVHLFGAIIVFVYGIWLFDQAY